MFEYLALQSVDRIPDDLPSLDTLTLKRTEFEGVAPLVK
jgi:hypothetical protein